MVGNLRLSTSSQCIKYLMFIFNLIFVITGIILLSIGAAIHGIYHDYQHFLDNRFFSVPSLLIAVGSIIFFIAFFGCCGAVKENYCMILTFTALMVLVFILELSAGIAGYVLRDNAKDIIENKMQESMEKYNHNNTEILKIWDKIQRDLECCGTIDAKDWPKALKNETEPGFLPMSCCPFKGGAVGQVTCTLIDEDRYKPGCLPAFSDFIKHHAVQLGGAGIGIAFMQALGIWFSIFLARAIKKNYANMS